jgi:hypothetical protein
MTVDLKHVILETSDNSLPYLSRDFLLYADGVSSFFFAFDYRRKWLTEIFISSRCQQPINVIKEFIVKTGQQAAWHSTRNWNFSHKKPSHQIIVTIIFKSRNYLWWWINNFFLYISFAVVVRLSVREKCSFSCE